MVPFTLVSLLLTWNIWFQTFPEKDLKFLASGVLTRKDTSQFFSWTDTMSGKILILKLLPKVFQANQMARFLIYQYLQIDIWHPNGEPEFALVPSKLCIDTLSIDRLIKACINLPES